jgi:protease IV
MSFANRAWRVLVAIKDGLALLFLLLFFWVLYMLLTGSPNAASVRDGALLLKLDGTIVEQPVELSPADVLGGGPPPPNQLRLSDLVYGIEAAATNDSVKALVLDFEGFGGGGQASLSRIGAAILKVRSAGKPVLAHSTGYFDDSYMLAAHASEIWLDPMGQAILQGPGGTRPYFKGLADKLGVNVHVYRVGTYKSAVEPFTRDSASPEAKAADQALVDTLWEDWKSRVQQARPKAQIAAVTADPMSKGNNLAEAARSFGLVDRLGDTTQFAARVAELVGREEGERADHFNATPFADFLAANPAPTGGAKIGILTVAGPIVDGRASSGVAGGDTLSDLVLDALKEKKLNALVVRVDSPGGSAFASEKIRQAILTAKAQKLPVVVSMGDVAASGGYWVAMTGDKVFAEPSTITGSIGVFSVLPTLERTLGQYGITGDGVATTPLSGQPDILRGTNAEVDKIFQGGVEDIYGRFTRLVAASRKMDVKRVDEIGQGRVWAGGTARQLGLIDAFGSLDDAVAEAARLIQAKPDTVERVYLEPGPSLLGTLFSGLSSDNRASIPVDAYSRMAQRQSALLLSGLYDAGMILHGPAIQVRCLACPTVVRHPPTRSAWAIMKEKLFDD